MQEFLTWRNDPLLVDSDPVKQNTWQTANDLLELSKNDSFLTSTGQLLLYPIMIRKIDFQTGERILQSFPYILLDNEWTSLIRKQSLTLAEKTHHYFQKSNYNRTILEWQRKIISYMEEQQRLPFPLFRLVPSWEKFFQNKQFVQFQSARGEDFQLPIYLDVKLAYLVGVIMGDGHLAEYFINIIDSSKEHIQNLKQMLEGRFNSKTEFFEQSNANAWNVNILGKWLVRFFNFLSGQPINARKYLALREPLILLENGLIRSAFWRGLMDADGSYKSSIGFGSAAKRLLSDFSNYLNHHNIQHRFYTQTVFGGTTHSLKIAGESRKQFAHLIGSDHPQKQQELQVLLARKVHRFSETTSTLRKRGVWEGQVITVNQEKLLNGYFDFTHLPQFSLSNLGSTIRLLRKSKSHTQQHLAQEIDISRTMLSSYELDQTTLPISDLVNILSFYKTNLHSVIKEKSKLYLHSRSSHCLVDTQPSDYLCELLQGLQVKDGGCLMLHGLKQKSIKQYKKEIGEHFSLDVTSTRVHKTVLNKFIREFFILRN
ncbi:MAG: helix-turn-helix domain-containing protein [Candidatus Heimdallarchaeota archaeon]|nr:helix-turn-helix domain-containing protein [Candidatus Heimdallarchaeota archaeon]